MKAITVGQLRQNPTAMLADVEAGATYAITRHDHVIGRVVPAGVEPALLPAKRQGASSLAALTPHEVRTAPSIDELIEEMRGEW
ncbi:MAG: type II toxin-antitoxin system Phd/YefM family antitoxin [Nakamurella sp.]